MNFVDTGRQMKEWLTDKFLGQPMVFHHVPKCAGTSVARALRMRYLPSQQGIEAGPSYFATKAFYPNVERDRLLDSMLDVREQILLYHLYCDVRCISAHVRFSAKAYDCFQDRYRFITILREPVSRFISHYFWDLNRPQEWSRIDLGLEEFLETEHAVTLATSFGEYYSALPSGSDFGSREAVEAAKRNLHKFSAVGFVEDMGRFESRLRDVLGIAVKIAHQNKGKVEEKTKRQVVTPELRRRIEEVCAPDIEIYEYAKAQFGQA